MSTALKNLCDSLKKIIAKLQSQQNSLSFLIMTGKSNQGKSALLRQGRMEELTQLGDDVPKVYYNNRGIILEISEGWLNQCDTLLQHTLKQINYCHKITGLVFCIDINDLLIIDSIELDKQKQKHLQYLHRFGSGLGRNIETHLIITKMDALAGFSEFYQTDHATDLAKPLGFSLSGTNYPLKKKEVYSKGFNAFLETVTQQVINKMHPARSTIKRTLIREFPLQLNNLRIPLQTLLQSISPNRFKLHSVYFTSAEQGGVSVDRLNKKIQQEYALMVQDTFPQATNYRAYFIEGALANIQVHTSLAPSTAKIAHKSVITLVSAALSLGILTLGLNYFNNSQLINVVNNELIAYDSLLYKNNLTDALLHLINARDKLDKVTTFAPGTFYQLKLQVQKNTQYKLHQEFLPKLTENLELVLTDPNQSPLARYNALKIYLMLGQSEHFDAKKIRQWFEQAFNHQHHKKQLALLDQILRQPMQAFPIKIQLVSDVRNYLNALPLNYLYYQLAKESFVNDSQPIMAEGFHLAVQKIPSYFTKAGFNTTIKQLQTVSQQLQTENWVLARQDLETLDNILPQAYCNDYVSFWKNFLRDTRLNHYENIHQGRILASKLHQNRSIQALVNVVQEQTKPDLNKANALFNQSISHVFTDINLMSNASTRELSLSISELEKFIATLSVVYDGGKTAFNLTKSRFASTDQSDPISLLYNQSRQLPEPIASWAKQLADDTWGLLIKETRAYINKQWQETVYRDYLMHIAKRYPLDSTQEQEISLEHFNRFFAPRGQLNTFINNYLKSFLDTSTAQWHSKNKNDYALPISPTMINEIIRANIISNMFFPSNSDSAKINFSLQKINLDPIIASLQLDLGGTTLKDTQKTESYTHFSWPQANYAKLLLNAIDGNHYEIVEEGTWALFKLLEKVNVLVDNDDSTSLQILFEVNSNSGRYLLKTANPINAFAPGVLNGFLLNDVLV